ncbi:hypothetical protein RaK2_00259 [Klebsiella phage vB_KleM_RaK2]|uniref:Uncharacterized protein n=1 Tax=Klebsiella phage vB_KleM_RaK2 TaxID=1147094 RepID=H6X466_9CAUD|nr:hypothetical protein F403_gp276 [Klebsiella phage vB_KleM_RaK2]AFA44532.1 hypothetical protein RaK2_00259 [Klebsiella phage vB_KleM_RaK2]
MSDCKKYSISGTYSINFKGLKEQQQRTFKVVFCSTNPIQALNQLITQYYLYSTPFYIYIIESYKIVEI